MGDFLDSDRRLTLAERARAIARHYYELADQWERGHAGTDCPCTTADQLRSRAFRLDDWASWRR